MVLRRRDGLSWLRTVPALVESTPIPSFLLSAVRHEFCSSKRQQHTLSGFAIPTIALILLVPLPFTPLRRIVDLFSFLSGRHVFKVFLKNEGFGDRSWILIATHLAKFGIVKIRL
jgi:hypothetical protein